MRGRRMRLAFIVWMRSLSDCLSDSHNGMTIRHWLVFYCQLLAWQFNLEFNSTRLETQKSACYSLFSCRNDTCWRIRWIMYLFSIPIPSPLSCCSPCNVLMLLFAVSCSRHMSLGSLCSFAWKWLGVSKQGRFLYGLYLNKHWPEPNRWKITVVSQREAINTSSIVVIMDEMRLNEGKRKLELRVRAGWSWSPQPWTVARKSLKWKLRINSRQSWHCCLTPEVVELEKTPLITLLHHHLWQIA